MHTSLQPDNDWGRRVAIQGGPIPKEQLRVCNRVGLEKARVRGRRNAGQRAYLGGSTDIAAIAKQRRQQTRLRTESEPHQQQQQRNARERHGFVNN